MTKLQDFISKHRELAEKATPGPWWRDIWAPSDRPNQVETGAIVSEDPTKPQPREIKTVVASEVDSGFGVIGDNAAFIAASRTALPLALAMLERAIQGLERYKSMARNDLHEHAQSVMKDLEAMIGAG